MNNKILRDITYGMYIVTCSIQDKLVGCTINTLTQITSDPAIISISLNKNNYTNEVIKNEKKFIVNIISEKTNPTIIGEFGFKSSKESNKFEKYKYELVDGIPALEEEMCGFIECEVINIMDTETHDIFIAKIINMDKKSDNVPMTYKYYHEVIKGQAPKTAPTYIEESNKTEKVINENNSTKKYRCTVCGYIYDDEKEQVPFAELPENWTCPLCGAPKNLFEEI